MRAPLALVLLLQQLASFAAVGARFDLVDLFRRFHLRRRSSEVHGGAVPGTSSSVRDLPAGLIDRGLTDGERENQSDGEREEESERAVPVRFSDLPAGLIDRGLTDGELSRLATSSRGVRENQVDRVRLRQLRNLADRKKQVDLDRRMRDVVRMFEQNQLTWDDYFRSNIDATTVGGNGLGQSRNNNVPRELLHYKSIIWAALRTLERNADAGSERSWDNVVPLETRQNIAQLTYYAQRELVLWGFYRGLLHWRDYFERRTDADGNPRIPELILNELQLRKLADWQKELDFDRRAQDVVRMFQRRQLTWDDYFRSNTEATTIGGNGLGQSRNNNVPRELLHYKSIIWAALRTLERNADAGSERSWDNVVPLETRQNIAQLTYDAQRELVLWGFYRGLLHWRDYFERRTDADGNPRIPALILNEFRVQQLAEDGRDSAL